MIKLADYFMLLKIKGKSLSEINPGSDEMALTIDDALQAIEIIYKSGTPILGGDILSEGLGSFNYAFILWGSKYHSLNWFCNRISNESQEEYCTRSYLKAINAVKIANQTAEELGFSCYIVLVI
jgi:hypothetical protein